MTILLSFFVKQNKISSSSLFIKWMG